jgi:hypothetical protein
MNHLHEGTRRFLDSCSGPDAVKKKIEFVQADSWVTYRVAKNIMGRMDEIYAHPKTHRMPDLLIIGRPNNGKTTLLKRFAGKHKAILRESDGELVADVIAAVMPHEPSESLFINAILKSVNIKVNTSATLSTKLEQVYNTLESINCKVIVLDEIQHLGTGGHKQQRLLMNLIKNLSSILGISFIAAGTPSALNVFSSDDQLSSRFKPAIIPVWENNKDLKLLLHSMESILPFEEPSNLATSNLTNYIFDHTDSTIGGISQMVKMSSVLAINKGDKKITVEHLKSCGYMTPQDIADERKKVF